MESEENAIAWFEVVSTICWIAVVDRAGASRSNTEAAIRL